LSKEAVAHWTPIEAIISLELIPKGPIPKGMVPDPPSYSNCVGFQRTLAATAPGAKHTPSPVELKQECQKRYETVRTHILNILINYGWLNEEAAAHGIKLTDGEVQKRFKENIHIEFASPAAFQQYLTRTGLTEADEILRFKGAMLSGLIYEKIFKHQHNPQQAYPEYLLRWAAKTHCATGYITQNCKEYKGPLTPGT
jgi:foldase protein PrsA